MRIAAASTHRLLGRHVPPVMRMRWHHLLFLHWPIEIAALRPLVPAPFEIDTHGGTAWVGLIPFTMTDVSARGLPRLPWRGVTDFHECNVRTYVRRGAEVGVYFFSLDAASRLAVWGARRFFHLAYQNARMALHVDGDLTEYRVDRIDPPRATMACRWRTGRAFPRARPGDLRHFLSERYVLFASDARGRCWRSRVQHAPWSLREATLLALDDGLVAATGLRVPPTPPVVFAADAMCVTASWPERC